MKIRTRFAPSPTGYLHIGGLRTALYAYLYTKKFDGDFILRIEDTDQEREVAGATELIYHTLKDTGLIYDEGPDVGGNFGPYIQSERFKENIYIDHAKKLIEKGAAYYCFCEKDRLNELRENKQNYDKHCKNLSKEEIQAKLDAGVPYVIRQDMPTEGEISYTDEVYGKITVPASELDDNVLIKSDGMPTYNFANVVDDHLMKITHVIRGSEYLSSTPKYNLLYDAFDWQRPAYIHLPPVMRDAHNKLSKRDGDASYDDFVQKGYLKDALVNYIALLGWSPGTNQEIFSLDELTDAFSIDGLSKSPAIFDEDKLKWMNGEYLRALTSHEFLVMAHPYLEEIYQGKPYDGDLIVEMLQARLETLNQIPEKLSFVNEFGNYDPELFLHKKMKTTYEIAKTSIASAMSGLNNVDWNASDLHDYLVAISETIGYKKGQFLYSIRIAITGKAVTPGGAIEAALLLGREETMRRLNYSLELLELQR